MDSSKARDVVSRRAHESALEVFRRLPRALRRAVTHLVAPGYAVGAVAVCVDRRGRVLLVKSRHQPAWSLPGGLLARGESPEDAVVRELAEEVGVQATVADLAPRPRVVVDPAARQVTVVFALTLDDRPAVDGVETVELAWFAADSLPTSLLRGTIESLLLTDFLS